jgi:hypothetical protein
VIPLGRAALTAPVLLAACVSMARGDCAGVAPVSNTALKTVPVATGLTGRPLYVTAPPGDVGRIFVLEQSGLVRIKKRGDPPAAISTFLDIRDRVQASTSLNEMGLLGLAFDPDYASNGLFYVNYTEGPVPGPWFTVVARYSVSAGDPDVADPDSEERLLRFGQPQTNHNGGQVLFGPDGYLYVATGDGGGANDAHGICGNGQNLANLLGKILRLDVRSSAPAGLAPDCGGATAGYRVPSDNPFAGGAGGPCDEIWSYGLRNPWRSAFDPANGDLYVADVGQNCWEEVNYVAGSGPGGENYGWRQMEGSNCFNPALPLNCDPPAAACSGSPPCKDPGLTDPVLAYSHLGGACSVTGGFVYRGCLMPGFAGTYFYGDFCDGFVKSFRIAGGSITEEMDWSDQVDPGGTLANRLSSFGLDAQGEIYITDRDGSVLRILPPFTDLEVSGDGAGVPLLLDPAEWTWEDLEASTMHPVSHYRIYRGQPSGPFSCVFTTPVPRWIGGDPEVPAEGALFAYLVTAVSPAGEESRDGDPPHTLMAGACP